MPVDDCKTVARRGAASLADRHGLAFHPQPAALSFPHTHVGPRENLKIHWNLNPPIS